ncbi:MAG: hypothetical protein O7J95_04845 [Planctomycetota bacterium]|nr:hypothetical protein [Planctomycetota bacterium]
MNTRLSFGLSILLILRLPVTPLAAEEPATIAKRAAEKASAGEKPSEEKKPRKARVGLADNQALVGSFVEESLTVHTRYGVLNVPVAEVVQIHFRPRLDAESAAKLQKLVARIAAGEDGSERILERLRRLGVRAYHELVKAKETADDAVGAQLEPLIDESRSRDGAYLEEFDEVVTERFTLRGLIVQPTLRFQCLAATLEIPCAEIVHVTFRELEVRKTWKVTPQHMETRGFLDTKHALRKGQKINLSASGSMVFNGQTFGPGGISNHTWNGRRLGCLQWRVGGGAWKVLNSNFEGKADQKGTLQLSVHVHNTGGSGEFKVSLKTKKRK